MNKDEYGYICFAYTKGVWYDYWIAKFTQSQWSHAFITIPPILGKEMVMEATQHGVTCTMFDQSYTNDPTQIYEVYKFKCDPAVRDQAILDRMQELEISYGYLEYPWFIWRSICRIFGKDIKSQNNWCQNGTKICSQVEREYLEDCGFKDLLSIYGKGSAAPQDIYDIVKAHPELFELVKSKS